MKMKDLCDNLNFRHRMAQQASRSSVELFTNLYFHNKTISEEGFITRVLQNAFLVLVPKYGIEGIVYTSKKSEDAKMVYNTKDGFLQSTIDPTLTLYIFQKVTVSITISDERRPGEAEGMRQKLQLSLIRPIIPGVSIDEGPKRHLPADEDNITKKVRATMLQAHTLGE